MSQIFCSLLTNSDTSKNNTQTKCPKTYYLITLRFLMESILFSVCRITEQSNKCFSIVMQELCTRRVEENAW